MHYQKQRELANADQKDRRSSVHRKMKSEQKTKYWPNVTFLQFFGKVIIIIMIKKQQNRTRIKYSCTFKDEIKKNALTDDCAYFLAAIWQQSTINLSNATKKQIVSSFG